MPERNVPWPVWVAVTLCAAVISSPLLLWYLGQNGPAVGQPGFAPPPITVEVKLPDAPTGSTEQPVVTDQPGPAHSPPPDFKSAEAGAVASERYLTIADLTGLTNWQLKVLRNEVYARHGRSFRTPELQQYFNGLSWYRPVYAPDEFPEGILSAVERYNVEFIADYQRRTYGSP